MPSDTLHKITDTIKVVKQIADSMHNMPAVEEIQKVIKKEINI